MSKNHEPALTLTAWAAPDGGFRARLGPNQFVEIGTSVTQQHPKVVTYKELPPGLFVRDIWTKFRTPRQDFREVKVLNERSTTPEEQAALLDSLTERIETYADFQTRLKTEPNRWDQAWHSHRVNNAPTPEEFSEYLKSTASLARRLGNTLADRLSADPHLLNGQPESFKDNLSSLSGIISANQEKKGG